MSGRGLGAYSLLIDRTTAEDRLRLACACAANLRSYRANFHELERYPNIQSRMVERAYDAERNYRILLDLGVRWMNELSDSGALSDWLGRGPGKGLTASSAEFGHAIASAKSFLAQKLAAEHVTLFDEVAQTFQAHKVQVSSRGNDEYEVRFQDATGEAAQLTFHVLPQPGDPGRISSQNFFSNAGAVSVSQVQGIYGGNDCHRAIAQLQAAPLRSVSLYGTVLGALATGRELIYRQAREIEEFGPAQVRGAGPAAVVIGAILIVVAILAAVAGVVIILSCGGVSPPYSNTPLPEGVCDAGIWLVLGALALFGIGASARGGGSSSTVDVLGNGNQEQYLPINAPSSS